MVMTLSFFAGIIGMLCILVAFILDEFLAAWRQNTMRYNMMNVVGSALLLYYGWSLAAWPFVILNAIWMVVAIVKTGEIAHASSKKKVKW